MIKIGISASFFYPDKTRTVFGPKSLSYVENDMMTYVARKGVLPVLIPNLSTDIQRDILLEMDGFILQGGSDIAPETYGESPIGKWEGDGCRDGYELEIIDFAMKNSKPLLGICRGFQLMNVYFGGTLYQDTTTQLPEVKAHRSSELYDTLKHPIEFIEDGFLDQLYADRPNKLVNSVHHQAVKELGVDLDVYAVSPDGLIEAFGYSKASKGKVFGVQWHPEFTHTLKEELLDADLLFEAFLKHT